MENYNDETQRLVSDSNEALINPITVPVQATIRPNPQPIPANRLALDAQIQAAADYQRRLRQRRRIYYIISITAITMLTFSILSFVAWILHSSSQKGVQAKNMLIEMSNEIPSVNEDVSTLKKSTLYARKHPTRTISHKNIKKLIKRSEMESDEDKDEPIQNKETKISRRPTRTRKLSFAPEKIIDYKPKFRPI